MSFTGSLDANVLLRILLADIPDQHQRAITLIDGSKGRFVVSDTALIELIFVLGRHYEFSRPTIREAVTGLTNQIRIESNKAVFDKALELFESHPKLSFEDCYLTTMAEVSGATPLWTFDKKLGRQLDNARLVGPKNFRRTDSTAASEPLHPER